jgi:hypothetical protein
MRTASRIECLSQIVAAALVAATGAAFAQSLPKEGPVAYVACWASANNNMTISNTHTASSYELIGNTRSEQPGGLYDKMGFRCVGTNQVVDGKTLSTNVCEYLDRDGHKFFTHVVGDGSKVTARLLAGTGKYEGMELATTGESLGPFPTIKPGTGANCNRTTGTYKLK